MYSCKHELGTLENESLSELVESRCSSMARIETTDYEPRARCTEHDGRERNKEEEQEVKWHYNL